MSPYREILGKPRPALIVHSDLFPQTASVTLIPITSTIVDGQLRFSIRPSVANGLLEVSQVMTDRVTTANRSKVDQVIGRLEEEQMRAVSTRLSLLLGLV